MTDTAKAEKNRETCAGDLSFDHDLERQIRDFIPVNEQEEQDKAQMLKWLQSGADIFTRQNQTAHITVSAWVTSPDRQKVLMAYHNLYHSWAWLGGHADGDHDLVHVARKEVEEESGVDELKLLSPAISSLEILCVDGHEKKGKYVSSHLHLNVTYLFEADPDKPVRAKPDENSGVAWFDVEEIADKSNEVWFNERIYAKLCDKMKKIRA